MKFQSTVLLFSIVALVVSLSACNQDVSNNEVKTEKVTRISSDSLASRGFRVAFIYGDTINEKYNFLIDAQDELEIESKQMDERLRRKLQRAEGRARELQQQAATMTQIQMQEAQLELQNLDIEMQQFQESLANEFRQREIKLQQQYVSKVDSFLVQFNSDDRFDMILNFQRGGNLLWMNDAFDITDEVLEGLNAAYKPSKTTEPVKTSEQKK